MVKSETLKMLQSPKQLESLMTMVKQLQQHTEQLAKMIIKLGSRPPKMTTPPPSTGDDRRGGGGDKPNSRKKKRENKSARRNQNKTALEDHSNESNKRRLIDCGACGKKHAHGHHTKAGIKSMRIRWVKNNDPRGDPRYDVNGTREERAKQIDTICKDTGMSKCPPNIVCYNCNKKGHLGARLQRAQEGEPQRGDRGQEPELVLRLLE